MIGPGWGVSGQFRDHRTQQRSGGAQSLALAGVAGQVREHARQMGARGAIQLRSLAMPSSWWAAAKQSSSASVRSGFLAPPPPRAGLIDRAAAYAALWHYGARVGVEEPGGFLRQLMAVIAAADPPHRARLSRGFLGLVAAAQLDEDGPAGIDRLREI